LNSNRETYKVSAARTQLWDFFARVGYDVSARTVQTAANLAIPEAVARPIERIELIADHQKLFCGNGRITSQKIEMELEPNKIVLLVGTFAGVVLVLIVEIELDGLTHWK
jgi:hypothetical protein